MNTKKSLFIAAATIGLSSGAITQNAHAAKAGYEKCKGVAAKGANSCGANGHSCGGFAKTDFDKNEWVYVKKGQCEVIQKLVKKNSEIKEFLKNTTKNARKYSDNFNN